jgi:hypothetical protein
MMKTKVGNNSISDFSSAALRKRAEGNHIWLNGFSCIRPSKEFCEEVGRMVIQKVMQSDMRDHMGISRMEIFTINAS